MRVVADQLKRELKDDDERVQNFMWVLFFNCQRFLASLVKQLSYLEGSNLLHLVYLGAAPMPLTPI